MTSSEKFSLKWNDFQENISVAFSNLREDKTFTDVTLVSEDGQQMEAHKIILTASSPFFMNILRTNKHPNPLIYLKGFKANSLLSLLDFIYHGLADVYQDDLDEFLLKAEELQLRGLTKETQANQEEDDNLKVTPKAQGKNSLNKSKDTTSEGVEIGTKLNKEQYVTNKTTTVMTTSSSPAQMSFSGGSAEDLKATLWSMISLNGNIFTCTVCGKTKDKVSDKKVTLQMERHVEIHVEGISYDCTRFDQTFMSKSTLHTHTYIKHQ